MFSKIEPFLLKKEFFPSGKDFFLRLTPVLGITLLEVAGVVLPLLSSFEKESFYSTQYSTHKFVTLLEYYSRASKILANHFTNQMYIFIIILP